MAGVAGADPRAAQGRRRPVSRSERRARSCSQRLRDSASTGTPFRSAASATATRSSVVTTPRSAHASFGRRWCSVSRWPVRARHHASRVRTATAPATRRSWIYQHGAPLVRGERGKAEHGARPGATVVARAVLCTSFHSRATTTAHRSERTFGAPPARRQPTRPAHADLPRPGRPGSRARSAGEQALLLLAVREGEPQLTEAERGEQPVEVGDLGDPADSGAVGLRAGDD